MRGMSAVDFLKSKFEGFGFEGLAVRAYKL